MRKLKRFFAVALATMVTVTSVNMPTFANEKVTSDVLTDSAITVVNNISQEQEQFNNALAENGTVTLKEDTVLSDGIELSVPEGKKSAEVTLDLGGFTLKEDDVTAMFNVNENVIFNIKNGAIVSDNEDGVVINSNGKVTLEEVQIKATGENSVAIINNSTLGAEGIVIYSATVEGTSYAVAKTVTDVVATAEESDDATENAKLLNVDTDKKVSTTGTYEVGNDSSVTTSTEKQVVVETNQAIVIVETNGAIDTNTTNTNNNEPDVKGASSTTGISAPTNIRIENVNYNTLTISWDAVEGATNYDLYRAADGVNFSIISANNTACTYTDTNLTTGTVYTYKIKTRRIVGADTYVSDFSQAKTGNTVFAAPTEVTTTNANAITVNIAWKGTSGASQYAVYRSTDANTGFAQIGTSNSTAYTDSTVTPGVAYYYKVAAVSGTYVGPLSGAAYAKTTLGKATSVKAKSKGYNSIGLTWKAGAGATQYEIYRSTKKSSGYKKIATVSGTSYTAKSLKINTTYYFKVKAKAGDYTSGYSSAAKAKTALSKVTNLKATVSSYNKVKLTWTKVSGAKKYTIYRSTKKGSGYKSIGTTTKTYYNDKKLTTGTTYYYKVKAVRGKDTSAYSSRVSAKPIPKATKLTVTTTNYDTAKLTWTKVSGADKYYVYRSTKEKSGFKRIKTTTELTYTDSGLKTGTTYYYRVYAVKGKVKGTAAKQSIKAVTNAPTEFTGDSITKTAIQLRWKAPDGATSYVVYRSLDNKTFTKLGTTSNLKYTDEGLTFGATYYYKVAAVRNNTEGKFTSVLALVATIPGVDNLTVNCSSLSEREIKLSWDKPDEYTNFEIYRSTSADSGYSLYATVTRNSYKDEISDGKVYYYRVYTTLNGFKSNYKQVQYAFASGIKLNATKKTIKAGATYTLKATFTPKETTDQTLTWTSSDTSIATVKDGVVTGVTAGTATITATTVNGKTATCKITVKGSTNVVVMLDPGHGGYDPGNVSGGYSEKDLNLKIAQYCKEELEKYDGITVYMTRTSDTYVSLDDRPAAAKEKGADMLISLHMNSSTSSSAAGAEVYSSLNATYSSSTAKLGSSILTQLVGLGLSNRGVKTRQGDNGDYYAVIRGSVSRGLGGIIVEHAFMSNSGDVNFFNSDAKLKALGVADATGIANYYGLKKK